jgi:hypothetical protein
MVIPYRRTRIAYMATSVYMHITAQFKPLWILSVYQLEYTYSTGVLPRSGYCSSSTGVHCTRSKDFMADFAISYSVCTTGATRAVV